MQCFSRAHQVDRWTDIWYDRCNGRRADFSSPPPPLPSLRQSSDSAKFLKMAENQKKSYVTNVYAICAFAAIGGGLFGFDISSMAGVLGTDAYKNYFGNPTGTRQGAITAAMPAGSLVGALISSFMGDHWGRKVSIQIGGIIWIIGSMYVYTLQILILPWIELADLRTK